jgi:elongation factor G
MATREASHIRNVALVGEKGVGKTALAEALVRAASGSGAAPGESLSDFEPEEKQYGHSLFPSLLGFEAEGAHINLIDTPGAPEMTGSSLACLSAVETVVAVLNPQEEIGPLTRQWMAHAKERRQPRCIVVNRIDLARLDLKAFVAEIQAAFGPECLPINLPTEYGSRIEDCLLNASGSSDLGPVADWHRRILDQVVELDETLMDRYLAGGEPDYAALHATFEKALDEAHVVPICFTSARNNIGIADLMLAIARHLPSPLEGNRRPFLCEQGGEEFPFPYTNDATKPLLAHVFRIITDPYLGKIGLVRIHQGHATAHQDVFIGHSKKAARVGHLQTVHGKDRKDVHTLMAGDIGAVSKIEELAVGDVLHDDHDLDSVHLTAPTYPPPTAALAIVAKVRGEDQKLARILQRFGEEDPTLLVTPAAAPHTLLVQGQGEMHLRTVLDRLKHRGLGVDSHPEAVLPL